MINRLQVIHLASCLPSLTSYWYSSNVKSRLCCEFHILDLFWVQQVINFDIMVYMIANEHVLYTSMRSFWHWLCAYLNCFCLDQFFQCLSNFGYLPLQCFYIVLVAPHLSLLSRYHHYCYVQVRYIYYPRIFRDFVSLW